MTFRNNLGQARLGWKNGEINTPPVVSTPSIITDGLVLNLDAGNTLSYPGSGTDWFDLTSNNNDATLINGASYITDGGGSISFDGVNDFVDCGSISEINSSSTVSYSYWGKKTASNKHLLVGSQISITNGFWLSWWSDGNVYCSARNGNYSYTSYALPFDTNWHHFVGVYNGTSVKIYIDGVLQATNTTGVPATLSSTSGNDFNIGYLESKYTDGNIANTQIYNRDLSENEVLQNYNATKSRFGL